MPRQVPALLEGGRCHVTSLLEQLLPRSGVFTYQVDGATYMIGTWVGLFTSAYKQMLGWWTGQATHRSRTVNLLVTQVASVIAVSVYTQLCTAPQLKYHVNTATVALIYNKLMSF